MEGWRKEGRKEGQRCERKDRGKEEKESGEESRRMRWKNEKEGRDIKSQIAH